MSKIEQELQAVTGVSPKANEKAEKYRARLVSGLDKVDDERWNQMTDETQNWANAAIRAVKDKQDIPAFPDAEAATEASTAESQPEATATETAGTSAQTEGEKAPKPAAQPKEKKVRQGPGVQVRIKQILIANPKASSKDIFDTLQAEGVGGTKMTIQTIRSDFLNSLYVLRDAGKLTGIDLSEVSTKEPKDAAETKE